MQPETTLLRHIRARTRDENRNVVTAVDEYNDRHTEAKIVRQAKGLKEHFGLEMVVAIVALLISVGGVVAYQSRTNGVNATAIDNLATAQKTDREEAARQREEAARQNDKQAKLMAESVDRIEALVNQTVDLVKQTQIEMRAHGAELVELRQDTKALWKWGTGLERQIGVLEAEIKRNK